MTGDRNRNSVLRQLATLQKMPLTELKEKWRDLYGTEPPGFKSSFLRKRLAYRIQELFYGGISIEVKTQIDGMAASDPLANGSLENKKVQFQRQKQIKPVHNGKILPGTRFIRDWNGGHYEVIARDKGFEFDGRMFRSLSAIATEITGTKWNGKLFFGVRQRRA